jgi:hypothetical protein
VATLDDLQSEIEASTRAADTVQTDTSKSTGQPHTPLLARSSATWKNYKRALVNNEP